MNDLRTRTAKEKLAQVRHVSKERKGRPEGDDDIDLTGEYDEPGEIPVRVRARAKKPRTKETGDKRTRNAPVPGARGTVVTVRKQRCKVALGESLVTAWLSSEIAAEQQHAIAVGDEVFLEKRERDHVVIEVLPRRTTLSRPDPFSPDTERVVAANIDVVVQVSAAKEPPMTTGLIDRYLIAIERGGAQPVICVNKIDQADAAGRAAIGEQLDEYRSIGIPIIHCSAETGEGLDDLREAVTGKTAVLVGHSGVGKSSLLRALDQKLLIATGEIHREGRSGRHTTTSSNLYEFPDGTRLIDTPGIRQFGLFRLDPRDLRFFFEEFSRFDDGCRFRDCSHLHEPDCAVRSAAERGELPRFARYVRMAGELDAD